MATSYYAPRFDVRIAGATLAADISNQVTSLTYDNNAEMADEFSFTLRNPNNMFTDSPLFNLGKKVEVHIGYGSDLKPMMLGEVTSLAPSFPQSGSPTLNVTGYDRSHRMRHDEPVRAAFQYMTDSAIADQIAREAGLTPVVDPSPFFHEHIQQTGSDFAFLKERAAANFFDVYVHWDKLYFRLPRPQTQAYVLEWGKNLFSYTPRVSSAGASGIQIIRSYSEELAETIVAAVAPIDLNLDDLMGRLGDGAMDFLSNLGRRVVRDVPVETPVDALTMAKSMLQEILEGLYEGSGSTVGIPDLRANDYVTILGVGKRFSGRYRLKRVSHSIDSGGYRTSFEVTQKARAGVLPFLRKVISELPSPNKQKRYHSPGVGVVVDNKDPKGMGRVKVKLPWFSDDNQTAWATPATSMGGDGTGFVFLPEQDEAVMVGFQHGDIQKPIIYGSVRTRDQRPPEDNKSGDNTLRVIQTKNHRVTFDDSSKPKVTIESNRPKDDGSQANTSTITMDSDGNVTISAGNNITLDAANGTGLITLRAANVDVKVSGKMDVKDL